MKNFLIQFSMFLLLSLIALQRPAAQGNPDAFFNTRRNALGLRLGFNRLNLLDRNSSALIYRGNIPMVGIEYQTYGENGYFIANLQAGNGSFFTKNHPGRTIYFMSQDVHGHVDTVAVPVRGSSTLSRLELGYLRKLNPGSDLEVAAGGMFSDEFYYQQGFVTPGLMNVAAISPALRMSWMNDSRYFVSVGISVPLVAAVSRSAWHNSVSQPGGSKAGGFFKQGTRVEDYSGHRQVRFTASVHRKLGNRWLAGLNYDLRTLKNSSPRELRATQHELSMSMQYVY